MDIPTSGIKKFPALARVWVWGENSWGTVTHDAGWDKVGRRTLDLGVYVTLDSDGVEVSCAHDQVFHSPVAD